MLVIAPISGRTQNWKWANGLGAANHSTTVKNIKPYQGTNVLVSGSFAAPTLALGGQTLQNTGQDDGYAAIVDDNGQYVWAAGFGGTGRDFVVDAAAFSNGDFVVAGNFNSISMSIGSANLSNSGETDAFVARYHADKTLAWVGKIGTPDIDEVRNVVVDDEGNTYISGHVLDKFTNAALYVFVRKLDAGGNQVWERKGNTQGSILQATALALDNQAIYLGGTIYGTAAFGATILTSDTSYAAFIVRYDLSGSLLGTYLNTTLNRLNGMQAHGGNLFACAQKNSQCLGWGWPLNDSKIHVLKLDTGFDMVWHKMAGGENFCQSYDIAQSLSIDDDGNIYVSGFYFSDTLHFAGQVLTTPFNIDYYYPQVFVLKYSPDGDEIWGKSLGGIHSDEATGIHVFGDDKFYLGGNFESDPVAFGSYNLHNTGALDSIYVHLCPTRFGRKAMGFLALFDKDVSGTSPEPVFEEVAIFPNPSKDLITIRLKSPTVSTLTVHIYSPEGRLLRKTSYPGPVVDIQENLSGLQPGVYFITLGTEKGMFAGKFLKTE